MVVQYYSDSLGLSRPKYVALEERYIFLLEQWLRQNTTGDIFLIDRARAAFTIDKLHQVYKEDVEYIEREKDILIIHEGVCDCAPRPVPKQIRRMISKSPGFIKHGVIGFLHKNRAAILKKGWGSVMTSKVLFEKTLQEWLEDALKKFKRVYILNIAPTNKEMELHSPGFTKNIDSYNEQIRKVVSELNNPKIILVDINAMIKTVENIDDYIVKEDGHHITAKTHRIIAQHLIELEKKART